MKGVEVIHHTLCRRTMNWIMFSTYHILYVIGMGQLVQAPLQQHPQGLEGYFQPEWYVFDQPPP